MRKLIFPLCFLLLSQTSAHSAESWIKPWEDGDQALLSGFQVLTKQISISGDQTNSVWKSTSEATVAAINQQFQNLEQKEIVDRTSYETGNGFSACEITSGRKSFSSSSDVQKEVMTKFAAVENNWLAGGGDAAAVAGASLAVRRDEYCSFEEDSYSAYCSRSDTGGYYSAGDSNAAVWMGVTDIGGEEFMVAIDYMDVIAPLPSTSKSGDTLEGDFNSLNAKRKGALLSAARSSIVSSILKNMGSNSE